MLNLLYLYGVITVENLTGVIAKITFESTQSAKLLISSLSVNSKTDFICSASIVFIAIIWEIRS